jgi:hypothetical protein
MLQNYPRFEGRQGVIIRQQRLKRLYPQITQIAADKEFVSSICVNQRPSAGNSGFNPRTVFPHDPARNP